MTTNLMIISSDGHVTAQMDDYAPYIDSAYKDEFKDFCKVFREKGSHGFDPAALRDRIDGELVDDWIRTVVEPGRLEGSWNPSRRLEEMEREGVVAEVLIPDFGLPFELYSPTLAAQLGYPARDQEHIDVANAAFNRWLVDFCSTAPERFAGMANISFADVDSAIADIRKARDAGLSGIMLPSFDEEVPLFMPRFDPIWQTLDELNMVVNSHPAFSATTTRTWPNPAPHPAVVGPLFRGVIEFYCRQVLDHLIWGGVLERHPGLTVAFTEQGSGWIPGKLAAMDHTYGGSYMRQDVRDVVKLQPSDYFDRQCFIGSSLLSKAEVENREAIGVEKMMIGVDFPHHEGTWNGGNQNYLRATLGASNVPESDARKMLGQTAARVFGFDEDRLQQIASGVGPRPEEILTPPDEDLFPRGDVHKPLSGAVV